MKRHALFVGVDQYADGHIPNLSCAVSDATDLHGFFKYGAGYDRVVLLRNPAVKQDVLDAVQDLTSGLENGDFFLFFFAGHGFRVGENHILVCNRDRYDDVKHEDAGLRLGQLKRRLSGSFDSALFLDACQSDILQTRGGEGIAERDLSLIHKAPEDRTCGGALTIVTSCDAGQTAAELSEVRHGLFTMAMLDLLKRAQGSHTRLDLSDAFRINLGRRMGEIAARSGLSTEQRPRFSCTGDSYFVVLDGDGPSQEVPSVVNSATYVECPICGKHNLITETFRCKVCGRDHICLSHFSSEYLSCAECAKSALAKQREGGSAAREQSAKGIKEFNVGSARKTVRCMLTAFRDGFQSVMGARVQSKDFLPAAEAAYDAGIRWFEMGGGAVFQQSFFSCQENAFDVMDSFRRLCPEAELQTLSRGVNIVGLESQPSDVIRLYAELFRKHGIDTIRNYDGLYDPNNLKLPAQCIHDSGMRHEVAVGILGVPPGWNVGCAHTPEFYVDRLKDFLDSGMPIDRVCFKDNSGTVSPKEVYTIIRQARMLLGDRVSIQFHTHDNLGTGKQCCLAALKGGADGLDLSIAPLSGGSCQPDLLEMARVLAEGSEFKFDFDSKRMNEAARIFGESMRRYFIPSEALEVDQRLVNVPVPKGALTANMMMMRDNGVEQAYERMVPEFAESFKRGGCAAASMTPVSQFYCQQALQNVMFGRFKYFAPGYAKLLLGYFGRLPIEPDPVLVEAAISFLASKPETRAFAFRTSRPVIELNDNDPRKGIGPARRMLQENGLPTTDENILIAATCKDKGIQFLKGNSVLACRFADCGGGKS